MNQQPTPLKSRASTPLPLAALGALGLIAAPVDAAVKLTPDHVVSGTVTDTLVAIDAPYSGDPNVADTGFTGPLGGDDGGPTRNAWEPDGTVDINPSWHIGWKNNGTVTFTFDLPDGAIIHNVYHKWHGQSNQSQNVVYSYNEGTPTSAAKDHNTASRGDTTITVNIPNDFGTWIDGFGLTAADKDFGADPDGDRLPSGVEAWFGTDPARGNAGLTVLSTNSTTTTFSHPRNPTPPGDLSCSYEWSPDLTNWYPGGSGPAGGPTVTLTPVNAVATTTLTATASQQPGGLKGTPYLDIAVKELNHFPENNEAPGETCWHLEQTWFWKPTSSPGSAQSVIGNLNTANSRNSNFLLNVGPDPSGHIIPASVQRLAEIGTLLQFLNADF